MSRRVADGSCSPGARQTSHDSRINLQGDKPGLNLKTNVIWVGIAAGAFHLAYFASELSFLVILYLLALLQLARNETGRKSFYAGLSVGLLIAAGRLDFFWNIFGAGCPALWLVYAVWIGLFTALARFCYARFGTLWGSCLIPFLWCGVEYFRSELYYLCFSWLSPGFAFAAGGNRVLLHLIGVYGLGFLLAGIASAFTHFWVKSKVQAFAVVAGGSAFLACLWLWKPETAETRLPAIQLHVAGVQMEFPSEQEVLVRLNDLARKHPEAELLVLSEYTFDGPIPEKVRSWCRVHHRFLLAGGKDPAAGGNYYDTAFVISAEGEIAFKQAKMVPIQFFKDGLAARTQELWHSPWGKLGICICYDLSYSRVTDRLVQLGAQALIVPTMDVVDWGRRQHELHARVAPLRAAEYGIPVFRVASSGISQLVDSKGRTRASAVCPGDGAILSGVLTLRQPGHLPLDRWVGPAATILSGLILITGLCHRFSESIRPSPRPKPAGL